MRERIDNLENIYAQCQADGMFKIREEIDKHLVKSLLESALSGLKRSKKIENVFEKESKDYSYIFVERYDILRKLIDAFLLFDKTKISNHQCSNSYLCVNHPELELDWETLETLRKLRNDVNYKGKKLIIDVWKSNQIKFEIYILTFIKEVQKKLS